MGWDREHGWIFQLKSLGSVIWNDLDVNWKGRVGMALIFISHLISSLRYVDSNMWMHERDKVVGSVQFMN